MIRWVFAESIDAPASFRGNFDDDDDDYGN